ncbi:uncharacterized protein FOMMEDRAFT_76490 [Fomitiporia mediterranea MF3/22]|uniref:uncharacterized protein n=1 Tax=Fomitiporia mediterranea (strain MF3/22) TaxID=694068 RepID=UPI0004409884|nr:uncharacterized protein FOMMEDRAFT_76490 [Fomitiporia mediterranea MF3/22]EJD06738.1 hypothetical protein FOMMEDRAFT_76490 [Fomitiporia mediterranea MF3/22]
MSTTLLIDTFHPFPSLALTLPSETLLADVPSHLLDFIPSFSELDLALTLPSGSLPLDSRPLSALWARDAAYFGNGNDEDVAYGAKSCRLISLRLVPRLRGGKGGFGSQLRAAGGRMSSQKTSNNDSCRDLNGRRLSTLKEAKTLAAYLEFEPERKKAQQEAQRAKLEKLEKRLGINGKGKEKADGDDAPVGAKRRFDDTEYLEQSRDIVDNVKSAVVAGMLKKKKKAKTSPSPDSQEAASSSLSSKSSGASGAPSNTENSSSTDGLAEKASDVTEKAFESPMTTPIISTASASLTAIGA